MSFNALLGNERLKDNLIRSLRKGQASHFYLICGPEGSGKHTLARLLAAALLCQGADKPCLACPACRKVLSGNHPDFILADDPEKKTVPVALIRQMREDMFIRPNEGSKKIYLFPRAQDMGVPGQNALLKILEEPPGYGVFLLLTDNPEKLLPTIRSRATLLRLQPLEPGLLGRALEKDFPQAPRSAIDAAIFRSGGFLGQAKALLAAEDGQDDSLVQFARAVAAKDALALLQLLVPLEKAKRETLLQAIGQWTQLLQAALLCRAGSPAVSELASQLAAGRSAGDLSRMLAHLQKAAAYAQANVSGAAICGFLSWALR